jgi:hypothetical protein
MGFALPVHDVENIVAILIVVPIFLRHRFETNSEKNSFRFLILMDCPAETDLKGERIGVIVGMIHRMPRLDITRTRPFVFGDTNEDVFLEGEIVNTDRSVSCGVFGVQTFEKNMSIVDQRNDIRR